MRDSFSSTSLRVEMTPWGRGEALASPALCHCFAKYLEFILAASDGSHDDDCPAIMKHYLITRLKLFEPLRRSWHEVIAGTGVPKQHYGDVWHGTHLPGDVRSAAGPGKGAVAPSVANNKDDIIVMAGCIFVCKKLLVCSRSLDFSVRCRIGMKCWWRGADPGSAVFPE